MPFPDFIVAGGRRCGTTSLYHFLNNHPSIWMHPDIDTAYFIESELVGRIKWLDGKIDPVKWDLDHSIEGYKQNFKVVADKLIGEKSADILYWKESHERLYRYNPNCKIIVQLRNPINRAWSHYWNEVGKGREDLSFENAIKAEKERSEKSDFARHHLSYVSRGFYDNSLESLLSFFPRENILVLVLEDNFKNPELSFNLISDFLGLPSIGNFFDPQKAHNSNWTMVKRKLVNYPPLDILDKYYGIFLRKVIARMWVNDPEKQRKKRKFLQVAELPFRKRAKTVKMKKQTYKKLEKIYSPHIDRLEVILDRSLDIWK